MKRKLAKWLVSALAVLMLAQSALLPVQAAVANPAGQRMAATTPAKTKGKWVYRGSNKYRVDENGRTIVGSYFTVDGKRYYARANGTVVHKKGWFIRVDGKQVMAQEDGVIKAGVVNYNAKTYYVNGDGLRRGGHFRGAGGKYYYTRQGLIRFGWNTRGATSFYVGPNGWLLTGRQTIDGNTYTFDNTGALQSGRLTVVMNGRTITDSVENILAQIVMAEVGGFGNSEVFKAQAIAAHSYIRYVLANESAPPQVVGKSPTPQVIQAVEQVRDIVLIYNGKVAFTPYYSFNNGKTNNAKDFWGKNLPYLRYRGSKYDKIAPNFEVKKFLTRAKLIAILDKTYGKGGYTLPADPKDWIKTTRNAQGYVTGRLQVAGRQPTVEYFYQTMIGLRSPSFIVKWQPSRDGFQFVTQGWGHGVGMSQYGAYYYITRSNWDHTRVLKYYYPGIKFGKV